MNRHAGAINDQLCQKLAAGVQLAYCNEFVGLVSLRYGAGADDYSGDPRHSSEQPRFGSIGNLAMVIAPRQLFDERDQWLLRVGV